MIGNIVNTVASKIGLAIISILLLLLNSNFLGSEGLGTIGLIVLEISIFLLLTNFVSGGSIIYYASRFKAVELLLFSYGWILVMAIVFFLLITTVPFLKLQHSNHIVILGVIQAFIGTHFNLLVGKKKIKVFNRLTLFQAICQILALVYFYIIAEATTVQSFIYSCYIAFGLTAIISYFKVARFIEKEISFLTKTDCFAILHYGFFIQTANIAQLLNYRLSYFLLDYFSGRASVGQFMAGVQLSEGLLLPARSIGVVQYSKISNTNSESQSVLLTLRLLKLVLFLTTVITVVLFLFPASLFQMLFGEDFTSIPLIIGAMAFGIIALAGEIILSRYFSGTAQQKVNAFSSTLGLAFTLIAGFILIPKYGFIGAGITMSISYGSMFIFLLVKMLQKTKVKLFDFLITKNDLLFYKKVIRLYRK